jgi:hypothetical protein
MPAKAKKSAAKGSSTSASRKATVKDLDTRDRDREAVRGGAMAPRYGRRRYA